MRPRFRLHAPSPAMVVACIALAVALGGTSYGLATGSINGREIKNNTIRSRDVRNRSLLAKDFKHGQLRPGPSGPQGPRGPQGQSGTAAVGGRAALEQEGAGGINSVARAGWAGAPSDARLRIPRATPDDRGARHFLITPYQYGMAIEYPGVVEAWV